jgi:hypothetical protein
MSETEGSDSADLIDSDKEKKTDFRNSELTIEDIGNA